MLPLLLGDGSVQPLPLYRIPLLSTGTYGFPKDRALRIATQAIGAFLETCELDVYLVVYDRQSYQLSRD